MRRSITNKHEIKSGAGNNSDSVLDFNHLGSDEIGNITIYHAIVQKVTGLLNILFQTHSFQFTYKHPPGSEDCGEWFYYDSWSLGGWVLPRQWPSIPASAAHLCSPSVLTPPHPLHRDRLASTRPALALRRHRLRLAGGGGFNEGTHPQHARHPHLQRHRSGAVRLIWKSSWFFLAWIIFSSLVSQNL